MMIANMKTSPRSQKLAGVIEPALGQVLQQLTNPETFGFLTIVDIQVSGDLSVVDVYVQSIGGSESYLKKLQKMTPKITRELMKHVQVRRAFVLRFKSLCKS